MTIIKVIMSRRQPFALVYAPVVYEHLRAIDARHYSLIRTTIEQRLRSEPDRETRNRKPLRQPAVFGAEWELRFGPGNRFRVFYEVDQQTSQVRILAIGIKERDRLFVGGEEVSE